MSGAHKSDVNTSKVNNVTVFCSYEPYSTILYVPPYSTIFFSVLSRKISWKNEIFKEWKLNFYTTNEIFQCDVAYLSNKKFLKQLYNSFKEMLQLSLESWKEKRKKMCNFRVSSLSSLWQM